MTSYYMAISLLSEIGSIFDRNLYAYKKLLYFTKTDISYKDLPKTQFKSSHPDSILVHV